MALRQRETWKHVEGPTLETLDFYYPYRQYTNLFIFRFVYYSSCNLLERSHHLRDVEHISFPPPLLDVLLLTCAPHFQSHWWYFLECFQQSSLSSFLRVPSTLRFQLSCFSRLVSVLLVRGAVEISEMNTSFSKALCLDLKQVIHHQLLKRKTDVR